MKRYARMVELEEILGCYEEETKGHQDRFYATSGKPPKHSKNI